MSCVATAEAELMTTKTLDGGNYALELLGRNVALDGVLAIRGWTPAQDSRVVYVSAVEK